jgi:hypothetical protein
MHKVRARQQELPLPTVLAFDQIMNAKNDARVFSRVPSELKKLGNRAAANLGSNMADMIKTLLAVTCVAQGLLGMPLSDKDRQDDAQRMFTRAEWVSRLMVSGHAIKPQSNHARPA